MQVSICMNTAHADDAMIGYPDMPLFEYTMSALRTQTFKDFEVVIADVLYESRKDYFQKHPEDFPIQHVPIKPNVFTPIGQVAISTTKNTCLLHAKGEIIIFIDDCIWFNPKYVEDIVGALKYPHYCISNPYEVHCGEVMKGKDPRKAPAGPVGGTYGNVALYLEKYLELNGYEELFDGGRGLEDCDFSLRMFKSGMEIYLINNYAVYQLHKAYPEYMQKPHIKCCRLIEKVQTDRIKNNILVANSHTITDEELNHFRFCAYKERGWVCPYVKVPCQSFMGADNKCFSGIDENLLQLYKHPSLTFSLREQRKDVQATIKHLQEICK